MRYAIVRRISKGFKARFFLVVLQTEILTCFSQRRFSSIISLYGSLGGALLAFGTACHTQVASTASGCGGKTTTDMSKVLDTHHVSVDV